MSENKIQKLAKKIKGLFIKTDLLRETVEDAIALELENANKNQTIQEGEKNLIKAGLKAGVTYFQAQSGMNVSLTDEQYDQIVQAVMDAKNKFMPKLIAQLRKK